VLCLQEVACGFPARDGSPGGDQFAELARRLPGWQCAHAFAVDTLAPDGGRRRLGSMVCSRHPILQVLRHSLPWPADAARACRASPSKSRWTRRWACCAC
jgi:endonuclease/exonuclease/phosphatase family metal-dependent hydrolase